MQYLPLKGGGVSTQLPHSGHWLGCNPCFHYSTFLILSDSSLVKARYKKHVKTVL